MSFESMHFRKPAFKSEQLKKHGFAGLLRYLEGHGVHGWRGGHDLPVEQVYSDVVSAKSVKDIISEMFIRYIKLNDSQLGWGK